MKKLLLITRGKMVVEPDYITIVHKLNEMVERINEQTKEIKHLWINLIDIQKEVLKIPTREKKDGNET